MQIQANLGSDLVVAFDELESPKYNYKETLESLELTERWELRSIKTYHNLFNGRGTHCDQLLYGVTHGGIFKDLRVRSAKFVDKHFEGIA